jgi:hypothetical protein
MPSLYHQKCGVHDRQMQGLHATPTELRPSQHYILIGQTQFFPFLYSLHYTTFNSFHARSLYLRLSIAQREQAQGKHDQAADRISSSCLSQAFMSAFERENEEL